MKAVEKIVKKAKTKKERPVAAVHLIRDGDFFYRGGANCYYPESSWCVSMTIRHIRQWFTLKRTPSELWISVYLRPGRSRQKLVVASVGNNFPTAYDDSGYEVTDVRLDDLLRPFVGRTIYIEVEYE